MKTPVEFFGASYDESPKAVIDLSAIRQNAIKIKNCLGSAKFCAVVKSDAYGHGLARVADAVSDIADCFAVSSLSEAVCLRFCGIQKPVLCLLPVSDVFSAYINDLSICVCRHDDFLKIQNAAREKNICPKLHFAVNSGMNRLGYDDVRLLKSDAISSLSNGFTVEGVFSHFFNSANETSVKKQYERFLPFLNVIKNINSNAVSHISASGGFLYGKYNLDMVRIGLLMYGYKPFNAQFGVKSAMKITARKLLERDLKKGENLMYGDYVLPGAEKTDIFNYGYSNGLLRIKNGLNDCCMSLSSAKSQLRADENSNERVIFENVREVANANSLGIYQAMIFAGGMLEKKYEGVFTKNNES